MIVQKLRRKCDGFICYHPVGPWYGPYQIVEGERLAIPSEDLYEHEADFEILSEGEQSEVEEGI